MLLLCFFCALLLVTQGTGLQKYASILRSDHYGELGVVRDFCGSKLFHCALHREGKNRGQKTSQSKGEEDRKTPRPQDPVEAR